MEWLEVKGLGSAVGSRAAGIHNMSAAVEWGLVSPRLWVETSNSWCPLSRHILLSTWHRLMCLTGRTHIFPLVSDDKAGAVPY